MQLKLNSFTSKILVSFYSDLEEPLSKVTLYPPASKASNEVANLTEKKGMAKYISPFLSIYKTKRQLIYITFFNVGPP